MTAARTIDVHAHYFPTAYLDLLATSGAAAVDLRSGRNAAWATTEADLRERIALMDRAGVDVQLLSLGACGPYLADRALAAAAARAANDAYAAAVRLHPARFSAFACLPLPHVDDALTELTYALDDLGMTGVAICTTMGGRALDDPAFDPVYAELHRRRAVLFVHPTAGACGSPLLLQSGLAWTLGAVLEDSAAPLQLLQSRFDERFADVQVVIAHLGGTLPFITERIEHTARIFMPGRDAPLEKLRHFWYDTANGHPAALRCACDTLGADRLVLGMDYPFVRGAAYEGGIAYLAAGGLTPQEQHAIRATNVDALLGPYRERIPPR